MSNTAIDIKRSRPLPEWQVSKNGKKKSLGGKFSKERIAQELIKSKHKTFNMGEMASMVYGLNCPSNRDKFRRGVPRLRDHMMARFTPLITIYGQRGTIEAIKAFESDEPEDVRRLNAELQRLQDRGEITEEKCNYLREILSLPRMGE